MANLGGIERGADGGEASRQTPGGEASRQTPTLQPLLSTQRPGLHEDAIHCSITAPHYTDVHAASAGSTKVQVRSSRSVSATVGASVCPSTCQSYFLGFGIASFSQASNRSTDIQKETPTTTHSLPLSLSAPMCCR